MTTGELLRMLSHWCPDTSVSIVGPEGEMSIGHLVPAADCGGAEAEACLTIMEG